jgi:YfiH family protein
VLAAFSGREFEASRDRTLFLEALGVRADRFCDLEQVHGSKVVLADRPFTGLAADGMVTKEKGLALLIRTADCVPVFFHDADAGAVGICHAGWRGAKSGVVLETVRTLAREFGSRPASIQVALGPAIRQMCYEVGEEFENYFPGEVARRGGRRFFDLVGAVKRQLRDAGVPEGSVSDSKVCTACSCDRFFSARREGNDTGRLISAILLK